MNATVQQAATRPADPLVEVRALKPFCGSYACKLEEAESIGDKFVEDEHGNIVKRREGRKRFAARVGFQRAIRPHELEDIKLGNGTYAFGMQPKPVPESGGIRRQAIRIDWPSEDHLPEEQRTQIGAATKVQPQTVTIQADPPTLHLPESVVVELERKGCAERVKPAVQPQVQVQPNLPRSTA